MDTLAILLAGMTGFAAAPHPAKHAQARVRAPIKRAQAVKARQPSYPAVELFAVNLHESLRFRPYDDLGRPRKLAERELTRILRCWRTGRTHKVDQRLPKVLYQIARHYPGHRVEIYSGYRPRAYCTRDGSRHLSGSAVDFRIDGVKNESVIAWLREAFHPAGVGYYPNGVHVHLDVDRVHDAYWVDAGDAPATDRRVVATGGLADDAIEARADEPVDVPLPAQAAGLATFEPPTEDPGIPQ